MIKDVKRQPYEDRLKTNKSSSSRKKRRRSEAALVNLEDG